MSPLLSQATDLVFYGMGTVFVFLTVLVAMTMLMSNLLARGDFANAGQDSNTIGSQDGGTNANNQSVDPKLVAAISAAVRRHRHSKQ